MITAMVVSLFAIIFIGMVQAFSRFCGIFARAMWWMVRAMCWLAIVPVVDIGLLSVGLSALIICLVFRLRRPRIRCARYGVLYPSWE